MLGAEEGRRPRISSFAFVEEPPTLCEEALLELPPIVPVANKVPNTTPATHTKPNTPKNRAIAFWLILGAAALTFTGSSGLVMVH